MIPIPINFDEVEIGAIPTALYVKKIKVGIGKCLPVFRLQAGVLYQKTGERERENGPDTYQFRRS
jgi:hypothetical protein